MSRNSPRRFLFIVIPFLLIAILLLLIIPDMKQTNLSNDRAGEIQNNLKDIRLPQGFSIELYASGIPDARQMTLSPDGTLYVGSRSEGTVYALPDRDRDGRPDEVIKIASGLKMPNGVAWRNGSLYVAEISRIIRYDDIDARLKNVPAPVVVYDGYPDAEWHGWKYIAFGPDGLLYVPVGAPCNICEPQLPFATITRIRPDGTNFEIYASGIRNTVGFDWDSSGVLWFTDNGRDYMGDDLPPDELNTAPVKGLNFGYPYVHGLNISDPEFGKGKNASDYTPPAEELQAHVAALGMKFYDGSMFPSGYHGRVFIAEHGSWNRNTPVGYRIETLEIINGKALNLSVFAEGWLRSGKAWGRPVDLLIMPDGSMLVSDDHAGVIYRISYRESVL